jgi:DNA-binding CsgD family transcriptional regulator
VVAFDELRARHLALATPKPDAKLAATVAEAAAAASARGARQEAVELAEHALRLTPPDSADRAERVLALAARLENAGELHRLTDLLQEELDSIPAGSERARGWLLLSEGAHIRDVAGYRWHLEQALAEARDDPALQARAVAKMSSAVIGVERIEEAEALALEVLPAARAAGPDIERTVLIALAWARGLRGRSVDDLCERWTAASTSPGFLANSPERIAGQRLAWRGHVERAQAVFERLLALADERGERVSYTWGRIHLCELALRVGNFEAAERLLDEWEQSTEGELFVNPIYQRCRALLAAGRGLPDEAEGWAADAIAQGEAIGTHWDWLEALRARGIAAGLAHEHERAAESFRTVWGHTEREGVRDPGVFPVAPDLVETLAELGETEEARSVTARLAHLAREQEHPWGLATARRCAALSSFDQDGLAEAAGAYGALGLEFDRARTLLALGRGHRRQKQWGGARRSLEQALAIFERLGAPGWAVETQSELDRLKGRRPHRAGELTPAEERVAALAAEGLSNKQIAATLYVTVHTVEVHLKHVYAKLGVTSRAQLPQRLAR